MNGKSVLWIESTRDNYWQKNEHVESTEKQCNLIITGNKGRVVEGFGSCFNELGMVAIEHLSEKDRQTVLDSLFATDGDCRFTLCRIPIGASDYALEWYSHNETDDDYE